MSKGEHPKHPRPSHEPIMSLERDKRTGYTSVVLEIPGKPETKLTVTQESSMASILCGLEAKR